MTRFQDGPAQHATLMLKRAPHYLRVTECGGKIDALDAEFDRPLPEETLFAYRLAGEPGMCTINARGNRGGIFTVASYRFCATQPSDEIMRDRVKWIAWCEDLPE